MKITLFFKSCLFAAALFCCWFVYESCTSAYAFGPFSNYFPANSELATNQATGIVSLPAQTNQLQGANADWKVFYSVGDGQWWMGYKNDLAYEQFYTFATPVPEKTYAELTGIYDDDISPTGKISGPPPPTGTNPVLKRTHDMEGNTYVKLRCNRNPRDGDKVTYIITYQNGGTGSLTGAITFPIDQYVFETPIDVNAAVDVFPGGGTVTPTANGIQIGFNGLEPSNQHNVFVHLRVKPDASEHELLYPRVTFKAGSIAETAGIPNQGILSSGQPHDPNIKTTINKTFCVSESEITFRIEFQNEGTAATTKVEVKDILDTWLMEPSADYGKAFGKSETILRGIGGTNVDTEYDPQTRELLFKFPDLVLKGTHQDGYGTEFEESNTKAYFSFKLRYNDKKPCSAIVNRAHVIFDCNAPIQTTTAYAKFGCEPCTAICADSLIKVTLTDSIVGNDVQLSNVQDIDVILDDLNQNGFHQHWYPSNVTLPGHDTYTLVASKECQRIIYEFKRNDGCNLQLNIDASQLAGICAGDFDGEITATVSGGIGPYRWNNGDKGECRIGPSANFIINKGDKYLWIGVQDSKGCHKEIMLGPIQAEAKVKKCGWELDVQGGIAPYTIKWLNGQTVLTTTSLNQPGVTNTSISATNLDLEFAFKAEITDSRGCVKIISLPTPNCIRTTLPSNPWWLWFFGLVGGGLVLWLLLKKSKTTG